jgi:hypothetical protein
MSATIYKFDKDTLAELASTTLLVEDVKSLAIQHIHDNSISDETTLQFTLDITKTHVPTIEEDFVVVIREKVDATSRGPNDIAITNVGEDVGKPNYKKKVPYRPWELPQGFKELKG